MKSVKKVTPLENYKLLLTFDNGEIRNADIKPLLDKTVFTPLKDTAIFKSVYIQYGAVTWKDGNGNEIDICPDNMYINSEVVK